MARGGLWAAAPRTGAPAGGAGTAAGAPALGSHPTAQQGRLGGKCPSAAWFSKRNPIILIFQLLFGVFLTLLGLCHMVLLFKVSPRIVTRAARLAYLILLSVGSNLIYQIDSILFRWVIFHLPLVKLFPRFPRAL